MLEQNMKCNTKKQFFLITFLDFTTYYQER